jgi:hypothetical protein
MPKEVTTPTPERAYAVTRREMTAFFRKLRTPQPGWPGIPDQSFVNALADSLLDLGKDSGTGVAQLQTLVHELQDRVNSHLSR